MPQEGDDVELQVVADLGDPVAFEDRAEFLEHGCGFLAGFRQGDEEPGVGFDRNCDAGDVAGFGVEAGGLEIDADPRASEKRGDQRGAVIRGNQTVVVLDVGNGPELSRLVDLQLTSVSRLHGSRPHLPGRRVEAVPEQPLAEHVELELDENLLQHLVIDRLAFEIGE